MSNVLIVEDDCFLGDELKYFIEHAGHSCTVFRTTKEVINEIEVINKYKIIILDIMMMWGDLPVDTINTGETGDYIYKEIRKRFPTLKIIIMSAKNKDDLSIDYSKQQNVSFIQKPVDAEKINIILREIISNV